MDASINKTTLAVKDNFFYKTSGNITFEGKYVEPAKPGLSDKYVADVQDGINRLFTGKLSPDHQLDLLG